ncbi:carboxymuconolactone decarboxylase family protein [Halomicrococcus gelatinilyticus]|uniref:carboxymuconolactone decarboxylase family protein n=1 Tax=Halomicrococcus gelatinilyticus TaxID=1702103 RepID=UPI002E0FEA87
MSKSSRSRGGDGFRKTTFTVRSFLPGVARFVRNLPALVRARRADRVSDAFAEKIMLAVTAVNECQYCTRYHSDLALETGVDEGTVRQILEGDVGTAVDDDELPALAFAQRYAEADESPGREAVTDLRAAYGAETAADVQAFVRAIYFGNLLGNSYDAVRFVAARRVRRARRCLEATRTGVARAAERVRERCPI